MGGEIILATDLADSVAAMGHGTPGGILGYAQITSNQGSITSETNITGLSITVTVGAGRRLLLWGWSRMGSSVADDRFIIDIKEGSTYVGKVGDERVPTTSQGTAPYSGGHFVSPSEGEHTYRLTARRISGTGSGTVFADASSPSYFVVEDKGFAVPVTELLY